MGIRSRLKGRLKSALGVEDQAGRDASAPGKHTTSISEDTGEGNLRGDEDVPWYLKYEDNDGWESTDAKPDSDED